MDSNYKKLGDFIERISVKNVDGSITNLQGININKHFMPSVANIIGTDLSKYKVVKKNHFACNRMHVGRDLRLPISVSETTEDFIVSPAYDVFQITKPDEVFVDYLMMWFRRKEFDRNCWFHTDTDVRGKLGWDSLCEIKFSLPSIEKQQEIVKEYKTVTNRIKGNEQLNQKLEETAQTIYKHWFVDFEFPNEDGKPYKSNGGEMVFNEDLDKDIPVGWEVVELCEICEMTNGFSYKGNELKESNKALVTIKNISRQGDFQLRGFKEIITERAKERHYLNEGDIVVAHTDLTKGIIISKPIIILDKSKYDILITSMDLVKVEPTLNNITRPFLYQIIKHENFRDYAMGYVNGSTVLHLSKEALPKYKIALPNDVKIFKLINLQLETIVSRKSINLKQNQQLEKLKDLLLSKMSKN